MPGRRCGVGGVLLGMRPPFPRSSATGNKQQIQAETRPTGETFGTRPPPPAGPRMWLWELCKCLRTLLQLWLRNLQGGRCKAVPQFSRRERS